MSKKLRNQIYIHMCNYSKSLKTTLQITVKNIKILKESKHLTLANRKILFNLLREAKRCEDKKATIYVKTHYSENTRSVTANDT